MDILMLFKCACIMMSIFYIHTIYVHVCMYFHVYTHIDVCIYVFPIHIYKTLRLHMHLPMFKKLGFEKGVVENLVKTLENLKSLNSSKSAKSLKLLFR